MSRDLAPKPSRYVSRTPVWDRAAVEAWKASRRGRGWRKGVTALVLVMVATLSACGGSDQPSAGKTLSVDDARKTVAAQQSADADAQARAIAGECFSMEFDPTRSEYREHESTLVNGTDAEKVVAYKAFLAWLPDPSTGCVDRDVQKLQQSSENATKFLAAIGG